jgi:hypothetical protein
MELDIGRLLERIFLTLLIWSGPAMVIFYQDEKNNKRQVKSEQNHNEQKSHARSFRHESN